MTVLRIAEVATRSGVPASTLRYYDQLGLVPAQRSTNGYRAYTAAVFDRLRFIESARRLDLPLDEIAGLLRSWETDPCASVKARLRPLLMEHLASVQDTIGALNGLHDQLQTAHAHLDQLPDRDGRCAPSCAFLLRPAAPVACALGEGRAQQVAQWRSLLHDQQVHRIAGGVRCQLPITLLAQVASLAAAEQQCCPFLSFDISLRGAVFTLTVRTPQEGLPLLADLTGLPLDEPTGSR